MLTILGIWKGCRRWKPLTRRNKEKLPWNPPTRLLKDKAEHVCSLWTHTHTHPFPTLTRHFIFVLTCRADLLSSHSQVSRLHCLNWAAVGRRGPLVSLFDFLSGDSPSWRPWVSCRKSTYDSCVCVWWVGVQDKWRGWWRRGGLGVKGEGKSQSRATIEPFLFY